MAQLLHLKIDKDTGKSMFIDNPIECRNVVLNSVAIRSNKAQTKDLYLRTNFMSSLSNTNSSNIPLLVNNDDFSLWVPRVPLGLKQGIITRIDYDIVDDTGQSIDLNTEGIESIHILISFLK